MEYKSIEIKEVYQEFASKIQPALVAFFKDINDKHSAFISALEKRYAKLNKTLLQAKDQSEKVEIQRVFKKELLEFLTNHSKTQSDEVFDGFFADYVKIINKEFGELKRIIHKKEPFEGYVINIKNNPLLNLRKAAANSKRFLILFLKRFLNFFRRTFRKKPIKVAVYKKRRILFRSMAKEFIQNQYLDGTKHLVTKLFENQNKGLIELWELDDSLDIEFQKLLAPEDSIEDAEQEKRENPSTIFKKIKAEYQKVYKEIENEAITIGAETFKLFDNAFQEVDTLELTYKTFNVKNLNNNKEKVFNYLTSELEHWKNAQTALMDDWSLDVEITLLYYSAFDEFNFFNKRVKDYIDRNTLTTFSSIRGFIEKSKKTIESDSSSKKAARDTIANERGKLGNQLIDKTITKIVEQLTGCFTDDFNEIRKEMLALVNQVSTNRGFIKNKGYLKAVNASDVKYISPRELISFEALPVFKERVYNVEVWTNTQLEKVRINLLGLGTVCDFTLESVLMMLEQKSGTAKKAILATADGFDRALNHLEKAETILQDIIATLEKDISNAINEFDDHILKLKDTENLLELNLKIAHIRAIERTQEYRKRFKQFIVDAIPKIKEFYMAVRNKVSIKIKELKLRIGVVEPKKYISFELSDFINQTQESLKKLPFVYQRLYRLNPTNEERFFVNREKELDLLNKALENWKKDRFITVSIIGEKGSGTTSLINYFLRKNKIDIEIISFTLNCKVYSYDSYFNLFAKFFGTEKFETNDQIIEYINQSDGSKIIVLENLQHMFLKKVNGFDCMNMFFELMANTMKKVLWIGAYTTHSWSYLDKTIHISNYFTNEIFVEPMGQDMIEEIIYKRNRLSGYQIVFQPDEYDLVSKKLLKLNDRERQKFLRREFFKTLSRISSGNISLAQLYWLQSTQVVSDEVIEISPINKIDFSFVKNLSSDELFAMQALIIHDGLELEDFSIVMGKPKNATRNLLTPMLEKGLLIKPNLKFNINPIIFRPVANYLASRNFVT